MCTGRASTPAAGAAGEQVDVLLHVLRGERDDGVEARSAQGCAYGVAVAEVGLHFADPLGRRTQRRPVAGAAATISRS
ncbi:hypothetical protein [Rathayibacter iranicus]|uniref:Uncharacterized protein n=2 Tax=Rathayibacter iranicus TaxID=59737 RepID=A0AAD1ADX2_9MICO|nr:hypothetical protein [Rathayibacter iranicus]AZZ56418.1 hypothetical protein C7V51_11420 [Rathayibacter iranicus]MWV31793.1 hypothetical protein [Rathayibacter iranicus NCPPB 2253 = VKM Ac-1602]PPI44866.1 hypothetical protein C5E09_10340 [Rathayibacter iranicus]PPI59100.1 hypothetical protein C5E08_11275 [Rathayibacter iranicus]PPI70317.1 hypothetical protein C5E01_10315 [Rathayibacter iranicus]